MLIDIPGLQNIKASHSLDVKSYPELNQYKIGQVFKAVVLSTVTENKLILKIDNQKLEANTKHPFFPGEELKVKVQESKDNIVLKVQSRQLSQSIINQSLKEVLPKEKPAGNLLNALSLITTDKAMPTKIPPEITKELQKLLEGIPDKNKIKTPEGLKKAIQQSGIFLEKHLANQQKNHLANDMKANWLSLMKKIDIWQAKINQQNQLPQPINSDKVNTPPLPQPTNQSMTTKANPPALKPTVLLKNYQSLPIPLQSQEKPITDKSQIAKPHLTIDSKNLMPPPIDDKLKAPIKGHKPVPIKTEMLKMPIQDETKMNQYLKNATSESLSRIQAQQLNSIPKEHQPNTTLMMDLSVKIDNQVQTIPVLIEKEKEQENSSKKEGEKSDKLSLMLALNLEHLGNIQLKVSQTDKKTDIQLWFEDDDTKAQFENQDIILKKDLESALKNISLLYHLGLDLTPSKDSDLSHHLLDINA